MFLFENQQNLRVKLENLAVWLEFPVNLTSFPRNYQEFRLALLKMRHFREKTQDFLVFPLVFLLVEVLAERYRQILQDFGSYIEIADFAGVGRENSQDFRSNCHDFLGRSFETARISSKNRRKLGNLPLYAGNQLVKQQFRGSST